MTKLQQFYIQQYLDTYKIKNPNNIIFDTVRIFLYFKNKYNYLPYVLDNLRNSGVSIPAIFF